MPSLDLCHHDVPVGERRDLGQVGDHEHLGGAGQRGEPAADLDRGLAADPGVDLVEDERRHRAGAGQRDLEGQHHPGQLAAGGALVQRRGLGAGVGGQQELDVVDAGGGDRSHRPSTRATPRPVGVVGSASCWSTATLTRACGIASRPSSAVTASAEPARRPSCARGRERARPRAPSSRAGRRVGARSSVDPLVGVVELEQPRGGGLGPGEHLVDGVAVLAGQRGQRRPALGDRGQPGRVGLEAGGVGRDVGGEVGRAGRSARRAGRRARRPRGSCSRTPSSDRAAPPTVVRQRVGAPSLAGQRLARLLGRGAQRVGEARAGPPRPPARRPRPAAGRPPRSRRGRTAAGRPPGRARGRVRDHLGELALGVDQARRKASAYARPGAASGSRRRTGRAPRAGPPAWSSRCWSDWPCTATSGSATAARVATGTDGAADEGARAALGGDVRASTHPVVLDLAAGLLDGRASPARPSTCTTPSTRACRAPVRTAPASARPPSSSPSAVTTMVLPAPVSPVITVRPGPSSSADASITPSDADPDLLEHVAAPLVVAGGGARPAPRQPSTGRSNLATSRSVNGASCSRASRTGRAPRRTSIRAPGGRSTVRRPSHHSTPAPSVLGEHLDREHASRRHHHRPGEQRVGADRHHQQGLDARARRPGRPR